MYRQKHLLVKYFIDSPEFNFNPSIFPHDAHCFFLFRPETQQEELERQKQEQVALLRELEEQRVKLEQMLLEAQQEREHLKAAVRAREQQAQRRQPQAPVQGVPAVTPGPVAEVSSRFASPSLVERNLNLVRAILILFSVFQSEFPNSDLSRTNLFTCTSVV